MVVGAAALALVAAACGGSGSSSSSSTGGTKVKGGTAVYALPPSTTPNYIFPYSSSADFSVSNISYLQQLLYRPLYWFGKGETPNYNSSLSVANAPQFSGNNVTITLKHYMWSNGQPVTASNVMFWINMETAEPANYGGYTGFPASVVKNVKVVSPTELTMTMDKAYSQSWFLYNELSQITPMPESWDRTASGPSHCTTTVSDCKAVYTYLDSQSKTLNSYASSPLWSVVNGPWKLSAFNADGHITFVPNKSYSGPTKASLSQFKEVPFTTDSAEYSVLQAPNSSVTVGYLPEQDAPAKPVDQTVGTNPLHGYTLSPLYSWGINYYVTNFQSTTGNAPIIKQTYFRQAMAYLMNQKSVIQGPLRGYGQFTTGPVPNFPKTQFLSPSIPAGTDPFPFSESKAKSLLTSHGWKVVPNGTSTCTNPSLCGAGVKQGQGLAFTFPFSNGVAWTTSEMTQLQSNAAAVGHQAEPEAGAVQPGHRPGGRQLRGHQELVQLGPRQLGRRLGVRTGLPADRRRAVHVRRTGQLGRLLQQAERLADQQHAHHQQHECHVHLAELRSAAAARSVPAERCLRADRDQGQPEGCHPAASYSGYQPGELVFHEVAGSW